MERDRKGARSDNVEAVVVVHIRTYRLIRADFVHSHKMYLYDMYFTCH